LREEKKIKKSKNKILHGLSGSALRTIFNSGGGESPSSSKIDLIWLTNGLISCKRGCNLSKSILNVALSLIFLNIPSLFFVLKKKKTENPRIFKKI
jgi:hypothetical protein